MSFFWFAITVAAWFAFCIWVNDTQSNRRKVKRRMRKL